MSEYERCVSDDNSINIPVDASTGSVYSEGSYPKDEKLTSLDHGFLFNFGTRECDLGNLYPPISQIPFYWQTFVENVDPLIKIFHVPTLGKVIRDIQGRMQSLDPIEEALTFAIYFAAVTSMSHDEVRNPTIVY